MSKEKLDANLTSEQRDISNKISWAMDQSYKLAVKACGIYDWTNQFPTKESRDHANERVEFMQVQILPVVISELNRWEDRTDKLKDYKIWTNTPLKLGDDCPYCYEKIEKNHYCNYG